MNARAPTETSFAHDGTRPQRAGSSRRVGGSVFGEPKYRENVVEAMNAGVSDYIAKPFTAATLCEKLEMILAQNSIPSRS